MLVLLWLTVSAPFITTFQQQLAGEEEVENTAEEKTQTNSLNFSEEYLHHCDDALHAENDLLKHDNCGHSALYIDFHGELVSPPPERQLTI